MRRLKQYVLKNFEQCFVLLTLITIVLINYFIPQKIAFLNFYFLPVILAGYYLGLRRSVLGAVLCILLTVVYVLLYPQLFISAQSPHELYLHIMVWGGFLILAGAVVGKQQEKLHLEIQQTQHLNQLLQEQQEELRQANLALKDYSDNLERRVRQRTEELEKSKQAVESLKAKVEEALYATMDAGVVKLIIEGRLRNEKRKISVMFSDLVGFTGYSEERSPELVVHDLNRYLNDMEPVLLNYHGHIDKYLGDGIMCEFGAPLEYENYRLLAVLAAVKMQEKMASLNYPWQMRIGIASGQAIMGLIGSKRQAYTSIGDVVNLAARMEKACPAGSILIDRHTLEGVSRFIDARLLKDLSLAGAPEEATEAQLQQLHQELEQAATDEDKAGLYQRLARLYQELGEAAEAVHYLERALQLQPGNRELKVAFAEAMMKQEEAKKIPVKGRKERVLAYQVIGIKDPLADRHKIPRSFYNRFHQIEDRIRIPEDVILPVEALDGTIGHGKVVAVVSYAIATELGIAELEKMEILHAGYIADIGKEIIPHHLLNRLGGLTASEIEEVGKHPVEGSKILQKMGYESELMLGIVRHSHEHFDGSGQPEGLRGEAIPLGARIVAVADAYDALTSWRPYRERWDRQAAFDELHAGVRKGLFDPRIVETLIKIMS